jgi:hypothetical protein
VGENQFLMSQHSICSQDVLYMMGVKLKDEIVSDLIKLTIMILYRREETNGVPSPPSFCTRLQLRKTNTFAEMTALLCKSMHVDPMTMEVWNANATEQWKDEQTPEQVGLINGSHLQIHGRYCPSFYFWTPLSNYGICPRLTVSNQEPAPK